MMRSFQSRLLTSFSFRCRRQCLEKFYDETKEMFIDKFNKLGDQTAQDAFLSGGITVSKVQRRRDRGGGTERQRNMHLTYKVSCCVSPSVCHIKVYVPYLFLAILSRTKCLESQ